MAQDDSAAASSRSTSRSSSNGSGRMRTVVPASAQTAAAYGDNKVINSRYTAANFLPKNLKEQFGRPLNAYFLLVVLLQFMSVIAPVNPLSTFLPLAFAFLLTAAKEGFDDYKRHKSDRAHNSRRFQVLRSTSAATASSTASSATASTSQQQAAWEWVFVQSKDLRVGDVIWLQRNDEIPADIVALSCPADSHGIVYIRTDNMDGEIDLKPREIVPLAVALTTTASLSCNMDATTSQALLAAKTQQLLGGGSGELKSQPLHASVTVVEDEKGFPRPAASTAQQVEGEAVGGSSNLLFATGSLPQTITAALRPFCIDVPLPTAALDKFDGRVLVDGTSRASLSSAHLLPQSCFIKNTAELIGLVVYTGADTKAALNKSATPVKWAKIDRDVSRYSKIIFIWQLISALVCGITGYVWSRSVEKTHWYVLPPKDESAMAIIIYPLRFFLLTTVMIPISFKFVVDISKYFMAMTMEWDLAMWDNERGIGAKVRNSGILEDLGQIEYILSDKTGTMTKNEMILKEVSIFGHRMHLRRVAGKSTALMVSVDTSSATSPLPLSPSSEPPTEDEVRLFWHALAVCNSIEVEERPTEVIASPKAGVPAAVSAASDSPTGAALRYAAVSPDEEALCVAAAAHGQRLVERSKGSLRLVVTPIVFSAAAPALSAGLLNTTPTPTQQTLIVEQTFAFASELKCMSILVSDPSTHKSYLYCKGADDKLMGLLSPSFVASQKGAQRIAKVQADLDAFAVQGLRTLLVCYKEVSHDVVTTFNKAYKAAMMEMEGRADKMLALRQQLEKDMELIGATAIEDCLQDGVVRTVSDLLDANIKVWMLTGDKIETAEQIALSCGLMSADDRLIAVYGPQWEDKLRNAAHVGRYQRRSTRHSHSPASTAGGGHGHTPRGSSSVITSAVLMNSINTAPGSGNYSGANFGNGDSSPRQLPSPAAAPAPLPSSSRSMEEATGTVLVVQGGAILETILATPDLYARFVEISSRCKAVVCARVTPLQKAQVTAVVRRQGKLTLAIGDGGNDVAMIHEAHVGVGIVGREGTQAALASDFSFTKFKYLSPLLFYHGHQSYRRTAFVVQYSFYKSMLIAFIQILFNLWVTQMSGASFWDTLALTAWNGLYTLPQTIFFVFDRVAPRTVLEQNPFLYRLSQRGYALTVWTFFGHIFRGCVQSVVALWLVYKITAEPFVRSDRGGTETASTTFLTVYSCFIFLQVFTVLAESKAVGLFNAIAIVGMPFAYYFISEFFYAIPAITASGGFRHSMTLPQHLANILMLAVLFAPHLIFNVGMRILHPNALDVLREDEVRHLSQKGYIVSTARSTRLVAKGFVSKVLLAGEIIVRSFVIIEEPGEELAAQMGKNKEGAGGVLTTIFNAEMFANAPPLHAENAW